MKTKNDILCLLMVVLAAFAVSCNNEEGLHKDKEKEQLAYDPSTHYSFAVSAGRTLTKGDMPDTRATLDPTVEGYPYLWELGDQVVMAVTPVDVTTVIGGFEGGMLLETINPVPASTTTFFAELEQDQFMSLVDGGPTFDFYSYFPANLNGVDGTSFPASLTFTMPASYTLVPDTFVNEIYAPMIAIERDKEPEISYPEGEVENPVCQLGGIDFTYEHILSYAAIDMDVRLLPDPVTTITMTVDGSDNIINGTMVYYPSTGNYEFTEGSNSVTIDITDGLTVGNDQLLYIPMPVKDLSRHTFTFTFTTANPKKYAYKTLTTTSGVDFERGKIHRIHVAPAAEYAEGTSFALTESGLYYIEAWGGDGGTGSNSNGNNNYGGTGGRGANVRGLYSLSKGEVLSIQVGGVGSSASGRTDNRAGGVALGPNYGLGNGGNGGNGQNGSSAGNAGAGGGAASGVLSNGAKVMIAGGGGGGGGAASGTRPPDGGIGGAGGVANNNGEDGKIGYDRHNATGDRNGGGGYGSGVGGFGYSGQGSNGDGSNSSDTTGGNGGDGYTIGTALLIGGGGGGGGGGGYVRGGGGGAGGARGATFNAAGSGGGGAGGASFSITQANSSGYTLPTNPRLSGSDGYVVITPIRQR
ncbi:hypothetical protein [Parabacteroides sp. PF5-6]|uniref:hypothetical protein n=1 Tax=Parabacteroides sp. PF5-6 TaxID=1742403 RepID=UPI00240699C5|nr:hypothetical protein [Parabacteroides sp. PF5-6]MDF9829920.1 hypothetical protein [Parabacteroides sp. PF5-6]